MKKDSENSAKLEGLDSLIKDLEVSFGKGSVFFNDNQQLEIERWSIEDLILSRGFGGGLPKGRLIEIYGPESNGKTSIACYLAAQVQKQGGYVGYIDAEQAIDPKYARTFGLDLTRCLFSQPDSGEDGLEIAQKMVESGKISLVVIDSVAALTPKAEIEGSMSDQQMGLQARMLSKACRKLAAICNKTQTTIIFINQIRMRMGGYGNPEVTTGGVALKFWCSVRIEVRKKELVEVGTEDNKKCIGMISRVKFVKNKTATPMRFGNVKILFGKGLQVEEAYIEYAVLTEVIQRKGTWYSYKGSEGETKLGQGMDNLVKYLRENPEFYEKVKKETLIRINPELDLDSESSVEPEVEPTEE